MSMGLIITKSSRNTSIFSRVLLILMSSVGLFCRKRHLCFLLPGREAMKQPRSC